jgi:hypothetical protein
MNADRYIRLPQIALIITLAILAIGLAGLGTAHASRGVRSPLTAVVGSGTGFLEIVPVESTTGNFMAKMKLQVRQTARSTEFTVRRAPDMNPDGICTGQNWLDTPGLYFTTTPGGTALVHYDYEAPFADTTRFDVVFEFIGSDGTVLRSVCMTPNGQ